MSVQREVTRQKSTSEPSAGSVPGLVSAPVVASPAMVTELLMFRVSREAVQRRRASRRPAGLGTSSDQLGPFHS